MSNTAIEIHAPQTREVAAEPSNMVTPMTMIERALTMGATPDTLERLLALQERWEANQARKAFDAAMAAAKAEIPTIAKNRTVDFTTSKGRTNYRYEDLAEVAETVNPILSKYGLSYRFKTSNAPNEPITVTCVVTHQMGYSEETTLSAPRDDSGNKNAIQQIGSTLTYLQRMTLKAALGLAASDDDDGQSHGKTSEDLATINEVQEGELRDAIEASGTDLARFLRYYGIERLSDMKASRYADAVAMLQKKREQRNG